MGNDEPILEDFGCSKCYNVYTNLDDALNCCPPIKKGSRPVMEAFWVRNQKGICCKYCGCGWSSDIPYRVLLESSRKYITCLNCLEINSHNDKWDYNNKGGLE